MTNHNHGFDEKKIFNIVYDFLTEKESQMQHKFTAVSQYCLVCGVSTFSQKSADECPGHRHYGDNYAPFEVTLPSPEEVTPPPYEPVPTIGQQLRDNIKHSEGLMHDGMVTNAAEFQMLQNQVLIMKAIIKLTSIF